MKGIVRSSVAIIAIGMALITGVGTSQAAMDNELSVQDGHGRMLTVQQWDVFLNGMSPLDTNPLSREWLHNGRAVYHVTGDNAEKFTGTLELGYQVSFPWRLGNAVNFMYTTPNFNLDQANIPGIMAQNSELRITSPPLLPGSAFAIDLGNGPGMREVSTFTVDVSGPDGAVAVGGGHGSVTGASGGVTLRPFARLTSHEGDSVTTYGDLWEMH